MIKVTFEAETMSELFEDIETFLAPRPNTPITTLMYDPEQTELPLPQEPKTRKPRKSKDTAMETPTHTPPDNAASQTPLDKSNADKQERELDKAAPVTNPTAPVYKDVADAAMEVVKVKGKPVALEVLRKFPHKDGDGKQVNSPQDLSVGDYTRVINALAAVK